MRLLELVYDFLYAYAITVYHEALALREKGYALAKTGRRRWDQTCPAAVKRVKEHRFFPVSMVMILSLLLIVPAYWMMPGGARYGGRGGHKRLSAREWQVTIVNLLNVSSFSLLVMCFLS